MVGEIGTGTVIVDNETFVIPAGARNIDLNNTGSAIGKFKGNIKLGSKPSVFVQLAVKEAYSFTDADKPYGEITIDATGTTIEVSANY